MSLLGAWAAQRSAPTSTLMLGDCFDRMREIPDASVDMVLCDLPYGTTQNKWDTVLPLDRLWVEYWRGCRGAVVLTAAQPFTSVLVCSQLQGFCYSWVWNKSHASNPLNAKKRPMQRHEDVLVFTVNSKMPFYVPQMQASEPFASRKGKKITNAYNVSGHYGKRSTQEVVKSKERYPTTDLHFGLGARWQSEHPTQKPVPLFEYLVRTYTNVGATVLDNCMGSGTTGVACANSGRRFIGIERDEGYFAIAQRRIREAEGAARERGGVIS